MPTHVPNVIDNEVLQVSNVSACEMQEELRGMWNQGKLEAGANTCSQRD